MLSAHGRRADRRKSEQTRVNQPDMGKASEANDCAFLCYSTVSKTHESKFENSTNICKSLG